MKKTFGFLFTLLIVFTMFQTSFAQVDRVDVADGKQIITAPNITYVTTTGSAYSEWFTLTEQDASSWYTYPWRLSFTAAVPTTGTIKVVNYLQGSFDKTNVSNVDTLASSDSTLSTTPFITTSTFNNFKYPYYRWHFDGQTGNSDSVTVTPKMWNPMNDKLLKP